MAKTMGVAKARAKRITAKQRVARVKNIAIARRSRKKSSGIHERKSLRSTEAAVYLESRGRGKSKTESRKIAKKAGKWTYKRLFGKK